jgi:hypothetical protein
VLFIKGGLSMMSTSVPILDIFAYTGYKYFALCAQTLTRITGWLLSTIFGLYISCMLAYFVLKSMAAVVPVTNSGPQRHLMLLGFAGVQLVVVLILCML